MTNKQWIKLVAVAAIALLIPRSTSKREATKIQAKGSQHQRNSSYQSKPDQNESFR